MGMGKGVWGYEKIENKKGGEALMGILKSIY